MIGYNERYRQLAASASLDTFKRPGYYKDVIGEPNTLQCLPMFGQISSSVNVYNKLDEFCKQDLIGSPRMFTIQSHSLSANIVRHVNSIALLEKHFGDLTDKNIVEFGVGWGGLMNCIFSYWTGSVVSGSYTMVDWPEVLGLSLRYTEALGHSTASIIPVSTVTGSFYSSSLPPSASIDLAIAEYSITEVDSGSFKYFTDTYLMPAKNIFVKCNLINDIDRVKWLNYLGIVFNITSSKEVFSMADYVVIGKRK